MEMRAAKYLLSVAVGLLVFWMAFVRDDVQEGGTLKVAFPHSSSADSHDPAQIQFANEYFFLESIYSPLVELSSDKGSPVSSVAREFYWKGNELHFVIRDDLRTIDGHNVGADDVIVSLKRLLILAKNTHGDFKNLICPDIQLESMEQDCPRIKKRGNIVVLDLVEQRDFVIPMLASIDFAIIPHSSMNPKTLKIMDYRNTSGPYYVERDEGGGHIVLKANPHHFHYGSNMPQEIVLVPSKEVTKEEVIQWYKRKKVEHITTIGKLSIEDLREMDAKSNNFYESIYTHTEVAFITEKGRERLSLEKRLAFAKSLQKAFHENYRSREGYRAIRQFFVATQGGQGLSPDSEKLLNNTFEKVTLERSGKGISLGIFKSKQDIVKEFAVLAKKYMPHLEVERAKGVPAFSPLADDKDMPDYMIVSTDSGFLEDIGLLSYTMNAGIFGLSPGEGKAWLADYMNTRDKRERLKKIDQMHTKSLTEGLMIPLIATPYVAVVKKPWKMHFSPFFGNNQFWKIRRD